MSKPFNLDLAMKGHPVVTLDCKYTVRIACIDVKGNYPVLVLLDNLDNSEELPELYTLDCKSRLGDHLNLVMSDNRFKVCDEVSQALLTLGYRYVAVDSEGDVSAFMCEPSLRELPYNVSGSERWVYMSKDHDEIALNITHVIRKVFMPDVNDSLICLIDSLSR